MAPACRDLVHGKTLPEFILPLVCQIFLKYCLTAVSAAAPLPCSGTLQTWLYIYIYILSYIGLNAKRRHATSRCFALIFRSALHGPLFFTYIESIYMYNRKTYIYISFFPLYIYIYIYLFDVCCMQGC